MTTTPSILRLDQNHRRSRAVIANGMVFLAGQVADDKAGDITAQAREALAKVDALLAEAGTDKRRALAAQIWLADMADFDAFNAVWDAWVAPGETPTRCCGKVELADPAYRVEIVMSALLPAA
ncbi:RidA family protein [Cupriavidus plantarum]|uniref:Enamine deaminase RidA (YjgF/YER057c/UK114 family) n=1 Tax=Cupriavidus plantarum TaxID=942865 RepID=A0A316F2G7_9BURK|nr:RidA family protein [Cupriavidus plantarum]PWK37699.1 enamine deaminase RidA (YjgF/YER057c/UK114 family) [Cupriavidus plantarum]